MNNGTGGSSEIRIRDFKIWEETPVQDLALAVNKLDVKKIEKLAEEQPELIDYQESRYGATLLFWAVGMEKYEAAKTLLECGADPDIICTWEGGTALYRAAGYSFIDNQAKKDAKFVRLLLEYGANPNIGFVGNDHNNSTEIGTTPLIESIGCGIEKTRALVKAGADINYQTPSGITAAIRALWLAEGARTKVSTEIEVMEYAYYLIVEKQARVTEPYSIIMKNTEPISIPTYYPVTILRKWLPALYFEGHKKKMEIVDEFLRQGVDYWSAEIPKNILQQIQKIYPDTWQEYVKKY